MKNQAEYMPPDIVAEQAPLTQHVSITRRDALLMLAGSAPALTSLQNSRIAGLTSDPLTHLGVILAEASEDYDWWQKKTWVQDAGQDYVQQQKQAALEKIRLTENRIIEATATDIHGLMVQAQLLALRNSFVPDEGGGLVGAIIRGLENLRPRNETLSVSDIEILSACRNWNSIISDVINADTTEEKIQLPSWAKGIPQMATPQRRIAMEAERERTGWQVANDHLIHQWERLTIIKETVSLMTASSFTALLAQTCPIIRPAGRFHMVSGAFGMMIVRGLERLGGRRTLNLHEWWGTEADDPPTPNGCNYRSCVVKSI